MSRRAGTDEAVAALFRAEYPQVLRSVQVVVGSRAVAEEIAQEAFCRVIERWRRVSTLERPGAWVQVVALRLALRHEGRRRKGEALVPAWAAATTVGPEDVDLARAIAALPDGQRQAIVLHHLCDLPVDAAASVLEVSPGTVKTQLHRGRARLAQLLGDHEEADDVAR